MWITYSCSTHCRSLGKSPGHLARQSPLLNCSENLQQTPVRPRLCFKTQHDGLLPLEVSRLNLLGDGCVHSMLWPTVAPFFQAGNTHIRDDIRSSVPTGVCRGTHAGLLGCLRAAAEQVHDMHLSDPTTATSTATRGRASPGYRSSSQRPCQPPGGVDWSGRTGTRKGRRKEPPGCRPRVRPGAFSTPEFRSRDRSTTARE